METRASYIMVGAFVLGLVAAAIVFVMWLAGSGQGQNAVPLRIHFTGAPVTGLTTDATVRYRGIPVGTVTNIRILPKDPDTIEVWVKVKPETPIWTDTTASLESAGLTGAPFIQLSRPTPGTAIVPRPTRQLTAAALRAQTPPHIVKGKATGLQEIFNEFPKAIAAVSRLANRAADVLDDDNRKQLSLLLQNANKMVVSFQKLAEEAQPAVRALASLSGDLKPVTKSLNLMMTDARATLKSIGSLADEAKPVVKSIGTLANDLRPTVKSIGSLAEDARPTAKAITKLAGKLQPTADEATKFLKAAVPAAQDIAKMVAEVRPAIQEIAKVGQIIKPTVDEFGKTAKAFRGTANEVTALIRENRRPLRDFAATGLYEFSLFLSDTRRFVRAFTRLIARFENDPSGFFFGNRQKGFSGQRRR